METISGLNYIFVFKLYLFFEIVERMFRKQDFTKFLKILQYIILAGQSGTVAS